MNVRAKTGSLTNFYENVLAAFPESKNTREPEEGSSIADGWRALASQLDVSEQALALRLSQSTSIELVENLDKGDRGLIAKLPYAIAVKSCALPLRLKDGCVDIVFANPFDDELQKDMQFVMGTNIRPLLARPGLIESAIASAYEELGLKKAGASERIHQKQLSEREIPRLASELLNRAIGMKASDIHMQPVSGGVAVRLRVDGVLRRLVIMPQAVGDGVIRYFKASSKLDPTNVNVPQDGGMDWELKDRRFDLRISTLPVAGHHEKLVIRILNRDSSVSLHNSGMSLVEIHTIRRMASNPSGVVLLCGPTGSGKTTTLYSVLAEVNEDGISIATVENPVEYQISGLAQTEVNAKAGMTFAAALRSILRQDPDIILIGEIRDSETAQIAMQSALTGHLVFSTLHTNAAVTAVSRLVDLEIPPPVLAEALAGIVSQRLLRRLCDCKQAVTKCEAPEDKEFAKLTRANPGARAVGCEDCAFTGYRGRVAVTEMIEINTELVELIAAGETSTEKLLAACDESYTPISVATERRIVSGDTSVAEANRVLGRRFWLDLAASYNSDELPDLSAIAGERVSAAGSHPGILVIGEANAFSSEFVGSLESAWFATYPTASAEQAKKALQEHDEIEFILMDLPASSNDEEILDYVAKFRVAVAWSRLPALLMFPEGHEHWQHLLVEHGATSRFASKHTPADQIAAIIQEAISENRDFRWGTVERDAADAANPI